MSNWDKIRQTCSASDLAAFLAAELDDGVPTDWLAWLLEEAHETPKSWGLHQFAEAILAALSEAAERNSAPKEDSHEP